jgi:hypothetical protein
MAEKLDPKQTSDEIEEDFPIFRDSGAILQM